MQNLIGNGAFFSISPRGDCKYLIVLVKVLNISPVLVKGNFVKIPKSRLFLRSKNFSLEEI